MWNTLLCAFLINLIHAALGNYTSYKTYSLTNLFLKRSPSGSEYQLKREEIPDFIITKLETLGIKRIEAFQVVYPKTAYTYKAVINRDHSIVFTSQSIESSLKTAHGRYLLFHEFGHIKDQDINYWSLKFSIPIVMTVVLFVYFFSLETIKNYNIVFGIIFFFHYLRRFIVNYNNINYEIFADNFAMSQLSEEDLSIVIPDYTVLYRRKIRRFREVLIKYRRGEKIGDGSYINEWKEANKNFNNLRDWINRKRAIQSTYFTLMTGNNILFRRYGKHLGLTSKEVPIIEFKSMQESLNNRENILGSVYEVALNSLFFLQGCFIYQINSHTGTILRLLMLISLTLSITFRIKFKIEKNRTKKLIDLYTVNK